MPKIHCWAQLRPRVSECLSWPTNPHPPPSHLLSPLFQHLFSPDLVWLGLRTSPGPATAEPHSPTWPHAGAPAEIPVSTLSWPPPGRQGLPQLEEMVCHQHHARNISRSGILQSSLKPPLPSRNTFYSYSSLLPTLPLVQGLAGALTGCFSKGDHLFEFPAQNVLGLGVGFLMLHKFQPASERPSSMGSIKKDSEERFTEVTEAF